MKTATRYISVAGKLCYGAGEAAREIERISGKPVTRSAVYRAIDNPKRRSIKGVAVRGFEKPAEPKQTGVPLAVRVYQDWVSRRLSETDGYPSNMTARRPLIRFNPYTVRIGGQP